MTLHFIIFLVTCISYEKNAGIGLFDNAEKQSDEIWEQMMRTNLSSYFYMSREVAPTMIKNPDDPNSAIANWIRRVDTLDFLALWEKLNNPNFKPLDFGGFKAKPGSNAFTIAPKKWIGLTNGIGLKAKSGKYGGGTFGHKDIALEFASWISAEVKLYIIKKFQRLKVIEKQEQLWIDSRISSKLNYLIHTDAIKEKLVNVELTKEQKNKIYAEEADVLNVALFGITEKDWRIKNKSNKGNKRDYASSIELTILSNLEFYNAKMIKEGIDQQKRLVSLNEEANKEKEIFNSNNAKEIYSSKVKVNL